MHTQTSQFPIVKPICISAATEGYGGIKPDGNGCYPDGDGCTATIAPIDTAT